MKTLLVIMIIADGTGNGTIKTIPYGTEEKCQIAATQTKEIWEAANSFGKFVAGCIIGGTGARN